MPDPYKALYGSTDASGEPRPPPPAEEAPGEPPRTFSEFGVVHTQKAAVTGPSPAREEIIEVLKTVNDPEIFMDVWTLGLIYKIDIQGHHVKILMTFTSMMCPAGPQLVNDVTQRIEALQNVEHADVEVTFTPPWEPPEELRAMLGI